MHKYCKLARSKILFEAFYLDSKLLLRRMQLYYCLEATLEWAYPDVNSTGQDPKGCLSRKITRVLQISRLSCLKRLSWKFHKHH